MPIFPVHPERIEGGVVEIPVASEEISEVLPPFAVECGYLAVQNRFPDRQLLPYSMAELLESLENVPALGAHAAAPAGDVQ